VKISPTQEKVLAKMEPGKWYSAYNLQCSLATLEALHKKDILKRKSSLGSMAFPRNEIEFMLK